jgi:hypothetical protein
MASRDFGSIYFDKLNEIATYVYMHSLEVRR